MITPKFLDKVVKGIEESYANLNNDITKRIAKKLVSVFSDESKLPKSHKDILKITNKNPIYDEVNKAIYDNIENINNEIKNAYLKSANEISQYNTKIANDIVDYYKNTENPIHIDIPQYENNAVKSSVMNLTDAEVQKVEGAYKKANRYAKNLTGTMPSIGQNAYVDACNSAYTKIQNGKDLNSAITEAIDEMAKQGVMWVDYDSGRRDRVEVAVARAVRTGINQMNADITLQRCAEMGCNYVQVSQHLGARVTGKGDYTDHSKWQGKVYSVDWSNPVFAEKGYKPTITDGNDNIFGWLKKIRNYIGGSNTKSYADFVKTCGYGQMLGICGINCRHSFNMFIPNVNQEEEPLNETENELQYNAEQKARAMERAIRDTKREIDALEYSGLDNTVTSFKLLELNNKLKNQEHIYNSHMRMYDIKKDKWRLTIIGDFLKNIKKYSIIDVELDYKKMIKNREIIDIKDLKNGLPVTYKPNSIIDKTKNGKVMQRRIYDPYGKAILDYDLTDHNRPFDHPTFAHKNVMDYSKKNIHGAPETLTDIEIILNRDIIQKGVNYFDKE